MQKLCSMYCPQNRPVSKSKKQTDVYSKRHNCSAPTVCAPTFCVEFVFGFLGCGVCVELSGGNVGGERVQGEEEGGRKGTVCCGDF